MPVPERSIKLLSDVTVICENPDSIYNYFAWPTIARLPDGRLMLVSSGFRKRHVDPFGKVAACYSDDDGKTWTKPEILFNSPLDDRDAGLAVAGERVIVTTFNNTVAFQRNIGKTEGDAAHQQLVKEYLDTVDAEAAEAAYLGSLYLLSTDGGKTFSAPKKCPVTTPHGPNVTSDGKFLYVGRYFGKTPSMGDSIGVFIENEAGEFTHLSDIANVPVAEDGELLSCEPHCIVLPDGKIIAHIRVQRFVEGKNPPGIGWEAFTMYQSISTDGGKTFTAPAPIFNDIMGGAPSHLYRHSSGALISVYAWRDYVNDVPSAICALISRDNGESWTPYFLCEGVHPWDMGYPATVEKEDGTLLTIFYDHTKDGPAVIKQFTWSLDGV